MSCSIGFVLLTHAKPRQTFRLVNRINRTFNYPPIVNHHDFSQCPLNVTEFPNNVSFVIPSLETEWGGFGAVEAVVTAIWRLYASNAAPDWFVLLSGSDYPIKPAAQVRRDFVKSPFDAHISHELIQPECFEREWQRLCYTRYYRNTPEMPSPFTNDFRCYAGEFWFSANRKSAEYILNFHDTHADFSSYYSVAPHPDESYFQCILLNNKSLRLSNNNLRYIEWPDDGSWHPKTLSLPDLPKLMASDAHFARKFDIDHDPTVMDAIDSFIDDAP